jgi:hypothetical protein
MLEHHVSAKITRKRLNAGPAARHVDDFSDWLDARGYKKRTVFRMLQSFAAWTDWLTKTGRTDRPNCARNGGHSQRHPGETRGLRE